MNSFSSENERPFPQPAGTRCTYTRIRHLAVQIDNIDKKLAEIGNETVIAFGPINLDKIRNGWKPAKVR